MEPKLANLVRPARWGALLLLGLWLQGAQAQTPAETASYQAALAQYMDGYVRERVVAFFREVNLLPPETVQVEALGAFSQSLEKPGEGQVAEVRLAVSLTTDQPSAVIRELRQSLARGLIEQGYRLDQAEAGDAVVSEGSSDTRPSAVLTVTTVEPKPSPLKLNETREYLTFGAIILALLASLTALFHLLLLPWRGRRRRPVGALVADAARAASAEPIMSAMAFELPEIPLDVAAEPAVSPPPLVKASATEPAKSGADMDPDTLALRQMPFDKVLDLLVAAEPTVRRSIIDRLDLNPPLKRRLEKELLGT